MTSPTLCNAPTARAVVTLLGLALALTGCAVGGYEDAPVEDAVAGEDLALGEVVDEEGKADGSWGAATTCKEVPSLPALISPKVVVSLDGLTLHLWDAAGTYDRVFPIGPGAIDQERRTDRAPALRPARPWKAAHRARRRLRTRLRPAARAS